MRRYLVVDDNVPIAENLAEIFRDEGAEVTIVTNGAEAIEAIKGTRFDVMLTDMRMPGMSGAQLVHEIRRIDPELPAIIITAYIGSEDLSHAEGAGLLAALPKPIPLQRLLHLAAVARRGGLVAVLEDDTALADNLRELLTEGGFSVVVARSVLETERLGAFLPFVALVDMRVPGGPPGEGMRLLHQRFPDAPLIVMTAFDSEQPPVQPQQTFIKPFDTAKLLDVVEKMYEGRGATATSAAG
jgi:CheY-like chemotaxis protein